MATHYSGPDKMKTYFIKPYIDELVQERRNSCALAMELYLSCIDPSIYAFLYNEKNEMVHFHKLMINSPLFPCYSY